MRRPIALALIALLALGGCRSIFGGDDDDTTEQYRLSRARWEATGIENYEFLVSNSCFCPLGGVPVRVIVTNGAVSSVLFESTGEPVEPVYLPSYRTFDQLFDVIEDAQDRNAYGMEVQYDLLYGFPLRAYIDYSANVVDEEFGWQVSDFVQVAFRVRP